MKTTFDAVILRCKEHPTYHGCIISETLMRTGPEIPPQMWPVSFTKKWMKSIVRHHSSPFVDSEDDFEIVNVTVEIKNVKE